MQYAGHLDMDVCARQESQMAPGFPPSSGRTPCNALPWGWGRNGEQDGISLMIRLPIS